MVLFALQDAILRLTAGWLERGQTHASVISFHKDVIPTQAVVELAIT